MSHITNILENEIHKLNWDITIHSAKRIQPDIVLVNKITKEAPLIDIAHPADHNLHKKRWEKLQIITGSKVQKLLAPKAVHIVAVIISATGMIAKNFINNLEEINIRLEDIKTQKPTILETCRIVQGSAELQW